MMDWGRAKNIILAVLVITNIFLIAVYGLRYEHTRENNAELREYTIEKLTENRIELECEIPEKPGKIPALTVQYETYDSAEVEEAIKEEQKDVQSGKHDRPESREEYQRAAASFLQECGLLSPEAVPAEFKENDKTAVVHYESRYDEIPLEECYMDVTFKDGIIMDLSRQWVKPVEEGSGKLVITEPVTALLSFIDIIGEERSNGTLADDDTVIVESIRLVYYVDKDSVSGNILYDTAFPSWRIEYNGGRIKYISAFEQ